MGIGKHVAVAVAVVTSLRVFGSVITAPATGPTTKPILSTTQPAVVAEFDIAKEGQLILLPVRFEGKTYQFMLDTGSTWCVFDESFRARMGKPVRTQVVATAGKDRKFHFCAAPEAFLGPLNLKESKLVVCLDMKMLRQVTGLEIRGIVGMNAIREYVLQIDFDRGKLALLKPDYRNHPEWGHAVPIRFNKLGMPIVTARMPASIKADFIVDTGSNGSGSLTKPLFDYIVEEKNLKTAEWLGETAAGTLRKSEARIANVTVGQFTCKNLIIAEGNFHTLGLGWLRWFRVTFDFHNGKMYLKKGDQFDRPDETDMSGLHVLRIDGKTVVHSLDKAYPADQAGILVEDIILSVNGKPAAAYEMWELRRLLCSGDKKKITMTIQRGKEKMTVTFLLKRRI